MPRLILIRHAKSAWDDPGAGDHARVLNARGRLSATAIGRWLADRGDLPDACLCSDAARTRETWALIAAELGDPPEPRILRPLYHAAPGPMLELLRGAAGRSVAMVGHNPGIGMLAQQLVLAPPAHPRFDDYPTGATTVIEFGDVPWARLAPGSGRVVDFVVPRDLVG